MTVFFQCLSCKFQVRIISQPCDETFHIWFWSLTAGKAVNALYLNASKEIYDVQDKVRAAIYKKDFFVLA